MSMFHIEKNRRVSVFFVLFLWRAERLRQKAPTNHQQQYHYGVGRQRLRGGGRGLHLHGRLLHHVDDLGLGDGRGRVGRRHHRGGRIPGGWPAHAAAAESRSGRSAADVPASVDDQGEDGEGEEAHQDDDGVGRAAVGGHALGLRGEGGKYTN